MRRANIIKKEKLVELYGEKLNGLDSTFTRAGSKNMFSLALDEIEVTIISRTGPYALVSHSNTSDTHNRFIVPQDYIIQKEVPTAMELFSPILDAYHPGKWKYMAGDQMVYIHYPELTITNSLNYVHKIVDLVVGFSVNPNTGSIGGHLFGKRYSWTNRELHLKYSHSHLDCMGSFGSFCLGGSSVISKFMQSMAKVNSTHDFELFIIQLKSYLEWESIEGRPFRSIREIGQVATTASTEVGHPLTTENRNRLNLIAESLLARASTDEQFRNDLFMKDGRELIFEPSFNETMLAKFENDEITRRMMPTSSAHMNMVFTWDTVNKNYVMMTSGSGTMPGPDSQAQNVGREFGLTQRVVNGNGQTSQSDLIYRLSPRALGYLVEKVNLLLLESLKPTVNDNNRDSITFQGESNNEQRAGIPDGVFA